MSEASQPRTFRIDADVMRGLEDEAKKQGATVNGLTCRILRKYVNVGTKLEQFQILSLPKKDLLDLLNSIDDKIIAKLAVSMGRTTAKEIMLQLYGDLSVKTYLQFLAIFLDGYSNWGSFYTEETDEGVKIRISHDLGNKWSLFLKNYLEASSLEVTSKKPEFKHVSDYSVILNL
jgi:hypothetical protein